MVVLKYYLFGFTFCMTSVLGIMQNEHCA